MDRQTAIGYIDMLGCLIAALILIVALANYSKAKPTEDEAHPPGQLMVLISWPADRNCDVDLWAKAPGDDPVGYSRKNAKVFDLLRDDLGHVNDPVPQNFETAFSRGLPAGQWDFTIHPYRMDGLGPVEVTVLVQIMRGGSAETVFREVVSLDGVKEVTVRRVTIDGTGRVTGQSTLPVQLRTAAQ